MTKPRVGFAMAIVAVRRGPLVTLIQNIMTTHAELALLFVEGAYIDYNRIMLVKQAREQDCSHIFFMDHDMVFGPDTVDRLLAHDRDIVGVSYNMRGVIPANTTVIHEHDAMPAELFRAKAVGAGCLLVKMSVFDKVEKPWFGTAINEDDELVMSEDVWFCNRARNAGFDVWCDPTIKVLHMGEAAY